VRGRAASDPVLSTDESGLADARAGREDRLAHKTSPVLESSASDRRCIERSREKEQTTDRRAGRDAEDQIAELRWFDEGGSFIRFPNQAEEIEMTDVRRTGPPRRLEDRTRYVIPIEGEVDGIWQRAFHVHLAEQVRAQPDLSGAEFFEKSLTINPAEIKFRFVDSPSVLPDYLDMIESAIPQANRAAAVERQRLDAAVAEAERELRERDQDIEQTLTSWAEQQPADS
jgi:hypothetical protein